jgi:hypothetical protein
MTLKLARNLLPVLALGASLSGCNVSWSNDASGVPLAELEMGGDAPSEVTLAGPDEVVITEGETFAITLDGDKDAGEALRFDRKGDELTIARNRSFWDGKGSAIVRITMPAAQSLNIAGSGSIKADTVAAKAELEIAGHGDIEVAKIAAETLDVEIAGSGNVKAAGSAKKLMVDILGSGDVTLQDLTADTAKVKIAGSGDVAFASDGTVDVSIAGSGDVAVTGNAKCSFQSAGSGTVTCKPAAKRTKSEASAE